MDISQITTPDDAVKLDDKQQYQFYFELVQHCVHEMAEAAPRLQDNNLSLQETVLIKIAAERLLYTLKALELRYLHIEENTMAIDVTESGYPNASALRFLANEISFLAKDEQLKLKDVKTIVDEFVDKLVVKKERISKEEVSDAAFSIFHTTVEKEKLHNHFVFGGVRRSMTEGYKFVTYWINFDVLYNRPFLSIMYFNPEVGSSVLSKLDEERIEQIAKKTVAVSPAQSVIYDLDKNLTGLYPKLFKRIDLGPIASIFSRDQKTISDAIRKGIKSKHLNYDAFAIELKVEIIRSIGTLETGGKFSFTKKKKLQNWSEPETFDYLMAPHAVIQYLFNGFADTVKDLAKHPIDIAAKSKNPNEI